MTHSKLGTEHLDKKPKLLYSLSFKFLCPGQLILQNAACREVQTVLRADVSLGQCPAGHSDSIPSQAQHCRIRHSRASAFQEQGLVATALWASASAVTNSYWKCCRPSPQPPPHTKAFPNSTQKWVHSVLGCRGSLTVILTLSALKRTKTCNASWRITIYSK